MLGKCVDLGRYFSPILQSALCSGCGCSGMIAATGARYSQPNPCINTIPTLLVTAAITVVSITMAAASS